MTDQTHKPMPSLRESFARFLDAGAQLTREIVQEVKTAAAPPPPPSTPECSHPLAIDEYKFCPTCGKELHPSTVGFAE